MTSRNGWHLSPLEYLWSVQLFLFSLSYVSSPTFWLLFYIPVIELKKSNQSLYIQFLFNSSLKPQIWLPPWFHNSVPNCGDESV